LTPATYAGSAGLRLATHPALAAQRDVDDPQHPVVALVRPAAPVAVAGQHVHGAVRTDGHVAQPPEPPVVVVGGKPAVKAFHLPAVALRHDMDADQRLAAQSRHIEIAFPERDATGRCRYAGPGDQRIGEAALTGRAHDARPPVIGAGADHVDLVPRNDAELSRRPVLGGKELARARLPGQALHVAMAERIDRRTGKRIVRRNGAVTGDAQNLAAEADPVLRPLPPPRLPGADIEIAVRPERAPAAVGAAPPGQARRERPVEADRP